MPRSSRLLTSFALSCGLAMVGTIGTACDSENEAEATPEPAVPENPQTKAGQMYKQGADGAKKAEEQLNAKHEDILEKTANPE